MHSNHNPPLGYERSRRSFILDTVAVALQKIPEVGEGALLKVDAEGPVPRHQLSAEEKRREARHGLWKETTDDILDKTKVDN